MKTLTKDTLTGALIAAALADDMDKRDCKCLLDSIKMGEEAADHLECPGAVAYFCTEDTIVSGYYWDAPSLLDHFIQTVNHNIPGFWIEPYNTCEYLIFPD